MCKTLHDTRLQLCHTIILIKVNHVKNLIGDTLESSLKSDEVIKELCKKFDMYVLRPEPQGSCDVYVRAQKHWESILGAQRVLKMDKPERLVDCIIGICAYAADNFDEGVKILERRQTKAQVDEVLKTLHPLLGQKSQGSAAHIITYKPKSKK